jgi:hypothetical protein
VSIFNKKISGHKHAAVFKRSVVAVTAAGSLCQPQADNSATAGNMRLSCVVIQLACKSICRPYFFWFFAALAGKTRQVKSAIMPAN